MNQDTTIHCNQSHELAVDFAQIKNNERRTLWVIILTFTMMILEIFAGYWTGSMALLADGYHMASHVGALSIAYFVYRLAKSESLRKKLTFGTGKLLPLGGYSSALGLGVVAIWMAVESVNRLLSPTTIEFNEAIAVAVLGLVVNVVSAMILGAGHTHHHHDDTDHHHPVEDHNHKSALVHVIADALTSVLAILALIIGKNYFAIWLDPVIGIVGSVIILRWAYILSRDTALELLDANPKDFPTDIVRSAIETSGATIMDLHLWKVGPGNYACQLVVKTDKKYGSDYYRQFLPTSMKSIHMVVEERF